MKLKTLRDVLNKLSDADLEQEVQVWDNEWSEDQRGYLIRREDGTLVFDYCWEVDWNSDYPGDVACDHVDLVLKQLNRSAGCH